jgi:hypothetical protein
VVPHPRRRRLWDYYDPPLILNHATANEPRPSPEHQNDGRVEEKPHVNGADDDRRRRGGNTSSMPTVEVLLPINDDEARADAIVEAGELHADLRAYADNVTVSAEITPDGEVLTFEWPEVEKPYIDRRKQPQP